MIYTNSPSYYEFISIFVITFHRSCCFIIGEYSIGYRHLSVFKSIYRYSPSHVSSNIVDKFNIYQLLFSSVGCI